MSNFWPASLIGQNEILNYLLSFVAGIIEDNWQYLCAWQKKRCGLNDQVNSNLLSLEALTRFVVVKCKSYFEESTTLIYALFTRH